MQISAQNRETVKKIVVVSCVVFALLLVIALISGLVSLSSASKRKARLERQLSGINAQIEAN